MDLELKKYRRKSFPVDAIQVTNENLVAVAEWCGGKLADADGRPFIQMRIPGAMNARLNQAFADDWVMDMGDKKFAIYTSKAFDRNFEATKEMTLPGVGLSIGG